MDPADFVGGAPGIGSAVNALLGLPSTTASPTTSTSQRPSQQHSLSPRHRPSPTTTTTTSASVSAAAAAAAASLVGGHSSSLTNSHHPHHQLHHHQHPHHHGPSNSASASLMSDSNGPILYSEPNRTSAIDDLRSVVIYIFIITVFFGFFLILPGIRNEKFPTFFCITTSLIVTSIILVSLFGTTWHIAEAPISAAYKAFSRDRIHANISVNIGLQSFNVTLRASKILNIDINYNERFYWIKPDQMQDEQHHALERGLPYPILTVVEYLSQDEAGFSWSRQYRLAGYYSYIILWLSVCLSALMFFLHCAAPKYGIYTMILIGCMMLFTNLTYATLVPRGERKLVIPFEGHSLLFEYGRNFWLIFFGGCLSLIVGTVIVIVDCLFPNFIFTTILDVDYDSHTKCSYKRKQQQQLELQKQREARHPQWRGLQTKQQNAPTKPVTSDHQIVVRRNSSRKSRQSESSVIEMALETESNFDLDKEQDFAQANYADDRRRMSTGNFVETKQEPSVATGSGGVAAVVSGQAGGGIASDGDYHLKHTASLSSKNGNLKSTDHQTRKQQTSKGEMATSRRSDTHHHHHNNHQRVANQQVRL